MGDKSPKRGKMKPWINVLMIVAGAILFAIAWRGVDAEGFWESLRGGDYRWAGLIVLLSLTGQWARAWRWQLMYAQPRPSIVPLWSALMAGYMANYAIPRIGEVTRCGLMTKHEGRDFATSLGTVALERSIDVLCLLMAIGLAFWLEPNALFRQAGAQVWAKLSGLSPGLWVLAGLVAIGVGVLLWVSRGVWLRWWVFRMAWEAAGRFGSGMMGLLRLRTNEVGLFLMLTAAIWGVYFLATFLWFWVFEGMGHLGAALGLVVMVSGSVARTLPIQGGSIGAYHYMVSKTLASYGVLPELAIALAIVNHGLQSVLQILMGAIGSAWLFYQDRKSTNKKSNDQIG